MSVSTPYFDEVFSGLEILPGRIERVQARIEKREARLERLLSKPPTEARLNKIKNTFDLIIHGGNVKADLEQTLLDYQAVELPKDEFTPSFWVDETTGQNWGVSVTVTDSPYDDTYVGGTPVSMQISGRYCKTGLSGFGQTRGVYFGPSYPLVDSTETIGFSTDRVNGDYSITLRLLNSDTREAFYEQQLIDSDGVQLI